MSMIPSFIQHALANGERATLIPIHRLQQVRNEIERFTHHEDLNSFQQWIVHNLYTFHVPKTEFSVQSILLLAIPHPFYAHVEFFYHGKTYHGLSLVMSDFDTTEKTLRTALRNGSHQPYHMIPAHNIPLKRLAVHSGFAVYGRNNICYIDGLGSNFSFVAYFSDIPCDDPSWTDITTASLCAQCHACVKHCPTGAIHQGRFVIDNEKCLSYLNESSDPFPAWLPKTVHHCVYDCLQCQIHCPMNTKQTKHVVGPIYFTESETHDLLSGIRIEEYSGALKKKATYLGLHQWPDGIVKNIRVLMELSE